MPAKIIFTNREEKGIIELYHRYRSLRQVAARLNRSRELIQGILTRHKVIRYPTNSTKLPVDSNYFKKLTAGSAYFLGLWIADGSITLSSSNNVCFSLAISRKDAEILMLLKTELKASHKLIEDRHLIKLSIGDPLLVLNIVKWGIEWQDKTHRLGSCHNLFEELEKTGQLNHFIRGFMDGDGCINLPRYQYNSSLTFTGTKAFMNSLQQRINKHCNTQGSLRQDRKYRHTNGHYFSLKYTGRLSVTKILKWIYKNKGKIYLKRKYKIFKQIMDLKYS